MSEGELKNAAKSLIERDVSAIAVSSYMGTRNPAHEIEAVNVLRGMTSLPVVSGHELASDIDSVRRAQTALLNARLLPVIRHLVESIRDVAGELGLPGDIRLVTTDGVLMNTAEAMETPVRMILSGPAASVKGVRFLTELDSCVLIDIGGTTADLAVIENGTARRTGRGTVVGGYKTSIHAVDIRTLGLGGDSRIAWSRGELTVGPRRVIPLSMLAKSQPEVTTALKKMRGYDAVDYSLVQPGTVYVHSTNGANDISYLNSREQQILDILSKGPLHAVALADALGTPYVSLLGIGRLIDTGLVQEAGLTPTDIWTAQGRLDIGDAVAAHALIHLYADRANLTSSSFIETAHRVIRRTVSASIISEAAENTPEDVSFPNCGYCKSLFDGDGAVDVTYRLNPPLVGIGAPASLMLADTGRFLEADTVFPEWGQVANAVGAASSAGGMHIDMKIMMDDTGRFQLYSPTGKRTFRSLDDARKEALAQTRETAAEYAERMGYGSFGLSVHIKDRSAPAANGAELYIDTAVVGEMRW
jgi:N-methylhydantoinase A/oxoprolinase/acetone carboxylase beta subunit